MNQWYVYIMSNRAHTLYTGMTNDLPTRVTEHKERTYPNAFTARYTFDRLVYYEEVGDEKAPRYEKRESRGGRERDAWRSFRRRIPTGTILALDGIPARWLR